MYLAHSLCTFPLLNSLSLLGCLTSNQHSATTDFCIQRPALLPREHWPHSTVMGLGFSRACLFCCSVGALQHELSSLPPSPLSLAGKGKRGGQS